MRIVYEDLLNHLKIKPSIEEISDRLFQLGHEHEIDGNVLDMELTPNRGDCLSLNGIARDLNIFFQYNQDSISLYDQKVNELDLDFENLSPLDCPKISFMEIEIDEPANKYHEYLEGYFENLDQNKVNFFTDISNYITYELGQPTHCYDANKLNGKIIYENKDCDLNFNTLLGSDIHLKGKNGVFICNNNEVISLAGVVGGKSTACSNNTNKVLIECAYFRPESIIGKSIRYNIKSEASHRFERGVDHASHMKVLLRFAEIVKEHARIRNIKICSFDYEATSQTKLDVDISSINQILGTNISEEEYLKYISSLGFNTKNGISVPSFRHDIENQNDLAEEIARLKGFNNIESSELKIPIYSKNYQDSIVPRIKSYLVNNGFNEVINFPFSSDQSDHSIEIENPLDSNKPYLRRSIKESLLNNIKYNFNRQKDSVKLFEFSDVYCVTKDKIKQEMKIGIISSGRVSNNYRDFSKKIDRKYIESLLSNFIVNPDANIEEINPIEINLKSKYKIIYCELKLSQISNILQDTQRIEPLNINFTKYKRISDFPSSTRDISFSIKNIQSVQKVITIIDSISIKNLKKSFIFDFYNNEKSNEVKLGYRFIFQSNNRTLTENDINDHIAEIIRPILKLDDVAIPGL